MAPKVKVQGGDVKQVRRPKLATPRNVRQEMSRVYGEVRAGIITSQEGNRLTSILSWVLRAVESELGKNLTEMAEQRKITQKEIDEMFSYVMNARTASSNRSKQVRREKDKENGRFIKAS